MTLASCSGQIVSYERATGDRAWMYDVKNDGTAQSFHGEMTRHDSLLLVAADPAEGHVYAFDERTGSIIWQWPSTSGVSSDLFVVKEHLILVTLDNELVALDVSTGDELWRADGAGAQRLTPITPTPVIVDGDIIWGRADGRATRRSISDGQPSWEIELPAPVSTDLTAINDRVFLGLNSGLLIYIDPVDGRVILEKDLGAIASYRWFGVGDSVLVGMTGWEGAGRRVVGVDVHSLETRWELAAPNDFVWTNSQPALAWSSVLVGSSEPALFAVNPSDGTIRWQAATDKSPRTIKVVGDDLYIGTFGGTLLAYRR